MNATDCPDTVRRSWGQLELHFLQGLLKFLDALAVAWVREHDDACQCGFCEAENRGHLRDYREDLTAAAYVARAAASLILSTQLEVRPPWPQSYAGHWARLGEVWAEVEALRAGDEAEGGVS